MAQVPNNSIITYVCTVKPDWASIGDKANCYFCGSQDVQGAVTAAIAADGMIVVSATNSNVGNILLPGTQAVTLTMQVKVATGLDYGSEDNVKAILDHNVYVAVGNLPSSSSIPRIQLPSGAPTDTGEPAPAPGATAPVGCLSGSAYDTSGSWNLSCWWTNLTTKGLSTVGLLAIALVVGIGIFVYARAPRVTAL